MQLLLLHLVGALLPRGGGDPEPEVLQLVVAPAETVSVTITGTGEPVVVIPGLLGAAYGFREVSARLADLGYQAITVEPLGTGASSRPEHADYSLTAQSRRVEAVLDRLAVREAVLLCHSVGASIGLRMAARRPELVAGIVSINGGAAESAGTDGLRGALRFSPLIKLFGATGIVKGKIREGLIDSSHDSSWVTDEVVDGYTAPFDGDLGGALDALSRMASATEPDSLRPQLHRIAEPVHLLVGADAGAGNVDAAEIATLAAELPRFRVDSIPAVGQYIHEEMPAVVTAAVEEMLEAVHPEAHAARERAAAVAPAGSRGSNR